MITNQIIKVRHWIVITFVLLSYSGISQSASPRTDYWYFGNNAGLSFSNNNLNVLSDSKMVAPNGSSSISDKNGNLLFYTNGETIWNASHEIMEYGNDLFGDKNLPQSTIIIPQPQHESIYFVFTLRYDQGSASNGLIIAPGLYYTIVDMSLNNGKGKVLRKNLRKNDVRPSKITAVHAADGESIWVISYIHNSDDSGNFQTFKIDSNGIGPPTTTSLNKNINPYFGVLKAAPNGEKIILSDQNDWFLTMADFDNQSGSISNIKIINLIIGIGSGYTSHGVEFSQDSKNIYFTANINDFQTNYLLGLDLYSNPIEVERTILDENDGLIKSAIQIASNGKIYRAKASGLEENQGLDYIGVINNPISTEVKQIDYRSNEVQLNSGTSRVGLPNFIQSYFRTRIVSEDKKCVNQEINLSIDTYNQVSNIQWDFGDGNFSTDSNPIHRYSQSGIFLATCSFVLNGMSILVEKEIQIYDFPKLEDDLRLTQCTIDENSSTVFNLNNISSTIEGNPSSDKLDFYESLDNAEKDTLKILNPESYAITNTKELFVRVYNEINCHTITNLILELKKNELSSISDIETCGEFTDDFGEEEAVFDLDLKKANLISELDLSPDMTITFYKNLQDAQTKVNELRGAHRTKTSVVWVSIESDELTCFGIRSFNLIVKPSPKFDLDKELILCSNKESITIEPYNVNGEFNFEWKNKDGELLSSDKVLTVNHDIISENQSLEIILTAKYPITGCIGQKNVFIKKVEPLKLTLQNVIIKDLSVNNTILIDPKNLNLNGAQYSFESESGPFQTNRLFENVIPGVHTIYMKDMNNCGTSSLEISVLGFPKFFTPNNDGYNDTWSMLGVSQDFYPTSLIYIYDRFGKILAKVDPLGKGWDGYYNGIELPSDDYWFSVQLIDNEGEVRNKTGSFSLIRR